MGYFDSIYAADLPHRAVAVYKTIARELKLSRATVCRALDDLCKAGLLTKDTRWRKNGGRTSNLYKIL